MLNREESILVVIDVQGNLAQQMHKKEMLFDSLAKMIRGARVLDIPIIWVEQNPKGLGETISSIASLLVDSPKVSKSTFSCVGDEEFLKLLEKTSKTQVILVGIEAHVCVYQTALDLLSNAYQVTVVTDAISSRTKENKLLALENLRAAGARMSSVEMALFEMLKKAEGPEFKKIIKIVK